MVPKAGVEPASPYEDKILSLACMPIPPLGHESAAYTHSDLALVNQMGVPAHAHADKRRRARTSGAANGAANGASCFGQASSGKALVIFALTSKEIYAALF